MSNNPPHSGPRRRGTVSLGVDWHLPDGRGGYRKRRFATSTRADSDLIELLASDGLTWSQIKGRLLYPSTEQTVVVDRFIAEGFGDVRAAVHLQPARSATTKAGATDARS